MNIDVIPFSLGNLVQNHITVSKYIQRVISLSKSEYTFQLSFHLFVWNTYCTFLMKAIKEDGGIPGFAVSAERIFMFLDASES